MRYEPPVAQIGPDLSNDGPEGVDRLAVEGEAALLARLGDDFGDDPAQVAGEIALIKQRARQESELSRAEALFEDGDLHGARRCWAQVSGTGHPVYANLAIDRLAATETMRPRRSETATVEDYEWASEGACRTTDPDSLFVQGAMQNQARAACMSCPVRTECLADALDHRIEFGVWGGMTERERRALLRRHPHVASWRRLMETARSELRDLARRRSSSPRDQRDAG
jgi:WhiB family redox-sensing transcriptional regulator